MQTTTTRFLFRSAPGHVITQPGISGHEPESMISPFVLQQLELVIAGADPFAAPATLTVEFPAQDGTGNTITVSVLIAAATTLADATDQIAAAFAATPQAAGLFSAASDSVDTITLIARSANTSIPAASFTATWSDAHTATVSQTVAAAAPSLEMGLFYTYSTSLGFGPGLTGTPRGTRIAALPSATTVIGDLRGVVSRVPNQTTLSADFMSLKAGPDAYPAGQVWPGLTRGEVWVRVDPASLAMDIGSQIHVVIAAGAFSVIGSVASVSDAPNTIRIDNAPAGNILGRVTGPEENLQPFAVSAGRYVSIRVNNTN